MSSIIVETTYEHISDAIYFKSQESRIVTTDYYLSKTVVGSLRIVSVDCSSLAAYDLNRRPSDPASVR